MPEKTESNWKKKTKTTNGTKVKLQQRCSVCIFVRKLNFVCVSTVFITILPISFFLCTAVHVHNNELFSLFHILHTTSTIIAQKKWKKHNIIKFQVQSELFVWGKIFTCDLRNFEVHWVTAGNSTKTIYILQRRKVKISCFNIKITIDWTVLRWKTSCFVR